MEFREYWNVVRKRGWIVLLAALVAAVGAFGVSQVMPKVYQATIQLSVEPARPDWGLNQATKDLLRNYVLNIKSHSMTQQAIDRAELDLTTDQFLADLDVSADSANLSLTIQAENGSPDKARDMAQTLADVFVEERAQWNQEINVSDRIYVNKVDDVGYVPLSSPKWKINTLAGAVFGAIVGGIIVFFLEWLESDILRTSADVQKTVGLPVLGAIPAGLQARSGGQGTWAMPGWIDLPLVLAFAVGGVLGAGLGALIVSLL